MRDAPSVVSWAISSTVSGRRPAFSSKSCKYMTCASLAGRRLGRGGPEYGRVPLRHKADRRSFSHRIVAIMLTLHLLKSDANLFTRCRREET